MALTKEDLQSIKGVVAEVVDEKIDDLATTIQKDFNRIDDRFSKMDDRFNETDQKILASEERTKGVVRAEIRTLENTVNSHHAAAISEFIKIHGKIDQLAQKIEKVNERTLKDGDIISKDIGNVKKDIILFKKY